MGGSLLLAFYENEPDCDLYEHSGREFDYFAREGGPDSVGANILDDLKPFISLPAELCAEDAAFLSRFGQSELNNAPLLRYVDIERLFSEYEPSFVSVDDAFYEAECWCTAHQKMEPVPHFKEDVLCHLAKITRGDPTLRMWIYYLHD